MTLIYRGQPYNSHSSTFSGVPANRPGCFRGIPHRLDQPSAVASATGFKPRFLGRKSA